MFHFIKLASTMQVMQRLPAVMKYPYAMWTVPKDVKVNVAEMKALSNVRTPPVQEAPVLCLWLTRYLIGQGQLSHGKSSSDSRLYG